MRTTTLILLILILPAAVAGQSTNASCPSISVTSPASPPRPGDIVPFNLTLTGAEGLTTLSVTWSIYGGEIVSGQGTAQVLVRASITTVAATAELHGLPTECPHAATETIIFDPPPRAIKVDVVALSDARAYRERLAAFVAELRDNPNNQGYIIIDHPKSASRSEIAAREKVVVDTLAGRGGDPDRSRVTIVSWDTGSGITELWRVPPGAENPVCEECKPPVCPTLIVEGPAGIPGPDEFIEFRATISGNVPKDVKYRWTINDGRVIDGQGTLIVRVKHNLPYTRRVAVTITADGSPAGCPNTASEQWALAIDWAPQKLGIVQDARYTIGRQLLDRLRSEMDEHPNAQLYVWVYCSEARFPVAKRRLIGQLTTAKIETRRITITNSDEGSEEAVFWLIRPGVENPAP